MLIEEVVPRSGGSSTTRRKISIPIFTLSIGNLSSIFTWLL
jgi:hypothetical protein